mmetsp:Transcript_7758/g.22073  ORF Transcript_7758/g.22073 Transcript_7758/m.22073 type:complete len:287 (-) Transcript_7758:298-1158(-)
MPKECVTAKDHILWAQRIQKEQINAQARGKFSLRNAVSVPDVPLKFKPGHVDPSALTKSMRFEPSQVGWDANGPAAKEFRRCLNIQTAGPRERHQFPETMYQEMGWAQSQGGPPQDRSEPSGSNPAKLGIGWLQNDGHGGVMAGAHGAPSSRRPAPPSAASQRPRVSKDGNIREGFGAPPYGTSFPCARFPAPDGKTASGRASAAASSPARQARTLAGSVSAPALSREDEFTQQEVALGHAMEHYKNFFNRNSANKWYRPLNNSDVATFADCYTKSWGKQLYGKNK